MLLAYENEAILASQQSGEGFDYVIPETTMLIENPGAILEGRQRALRRTGSTSC